MTYGINCYIWDVELGNAAYVDAAHRDVAIDMGSRNPFSPFEHLNQRHGVTRLDYLIPSHLHYDHISDIHNLAHFEVRPRLLNVNSTAIELLDERLDEADPETEQPLIEAGERFFALRDHYRPTTEDPSGPDWADRATFTNYSLPCAKLEGSLYEQLNNASVVTAVERGGYKIVFTGDMMERGLETLMDDSTAVTLVSDANVLVAPHHGRQSGFYGPFVEAVDPDVVIFSDKGGHAVGHGAQRQYREYTSGVNVYNETTGEWDSDRHVLTTRKDGRLLIQANSSTSWQFRKRPISEADRQQTRAQAR